MPTSSFPRSFLLLSSLSLTLFSCQAPKSLSTADPIDTSRYHHSPSPPLAPSTPPREEDPFLKKEAPISRPSSPSLNPSGSSLSGLQRSTSSSQTGEIIDQNSFLE